MNNSHMKMSHMKNSHINNAKKTPTQQQQATAKKTTSLAVKTDVKAGPIIIVRRPR